jgi:hypothetical protein
MLAPKQAARMQVANVTALIRLFLPHVSGFLLKMRQPKCHDDSRLRDKLTGPNVECIGVYTTLETIAR